MNQIIISNFYNFFNFQNYKFIKNPLLELCNKSKIKGTILISSEGINGSICGNKADINTVYDFLANNLKQLKIDYKESIINFTPFNKMKVKIKSEIVSLKIDDLDIVNNGQYIDTTSWDQFIKQPEVILIDTRNDYEVELGRFKGAINPQTKSFSELPKWVINNLKDKQKMKIAMYCTGGIRCEKSTAYLKKQGFEQVYHLRGGILEYLAQTKNINNNWQGDCFVFDERITVDANLAPKAVNLCKYCKKMIKNNDYKSNICLNCKQ